VGVLQIPGAKDPDEYIKKYGADRFKALLDGVGNALDFKLGQLRGKYDLKQDAQRLEYIKEAVLLLADRSNPTEQDVYAGRLAEETNISKTAILAQLEDAVKKGNARRRRERQREILHSGEMDTIRVPYQAGGQNALGAASAEQRLIVAMLREPSYIPLVQAQLRPEDIVMPDLREAYEAEFRCRDEGVPVSMALLATRLSDKTMNELSRLAAQYSDVNATEEDVKLYLERIANGAAKKSSAAQMSGEELNDYLRRLREKKQGNIEPEE
jgi:DNA primase